MRLVGIFLALSFSFSVSQASAEDLFINGKPGTVQEGQAVVPQTTVGGYPIYNDAEGWRVLRITSVQAGAINGAEPVNLGQVILGQLDSNGMPLAQMVVVANLMTVGTNQYVGGEPCGGNHLVAVKRPAGRDDNCMTLNVESNAEATYFVVQVTQTRGGGRRYIVHFVLTADALGFPGTREVDWSPNSLKADPGKAALVEKVKSWALLLQEGTEKAIGFSKPADAFASVPSYRTLLAAK